MMIEFTMHPSDYECLVNNAPEGSTLHSVLSTAARDNRDGDKPTWKVAGDVLDIIKILRLAREHCPDAVEDIRRGMNLYSLGN